jgi:hypothetical protein
LAEVEEADETVEAELLVEVVPVLDGGIIFQGCGRDKVILLWSVPVELWLQTLGIQEVLAIS